MKKAAIIIGAGPAGLTAAYYLLKKKRPAKTLKSQKIFSKTAFLTNFDFYGEMQKPGILFGKTL